MKDRMKRLFAVLLSLVLLAVLLPTPGQAQAETLSGQAYAVADSVFAQIDAMEEQPARRNANQTQLTDAAVELVMATDSYEEGSLERKGDAFTWMTDQGIRCIYSPRMRQIRENMTAPEDTAQDVIVNEPVATRGGSPDGNQVYLVGPYYGHDDSFTDQYKKEARRIASALGDTDGYTLYSGTEATVEKVAEAVANGAVVIFDSHGTTDYEDGYDYVTGATGSYLCLTSAEGLTEEDYDDGAAYDGEGAAINGATIANHMDKNSPGGIVWMALCLGMATDTLCQPMRQKGVEVVYGYSQSITFAGDYLFEETFWQEMLQGNTVAASIAEMKSRWGNWDWSTQIASYYGYSDGYATISAARRDYSSFPVVVSDEDAHPGQRYKNSVYGACSLQNVKSTYYLNVVAEPEDFDLHYVDQPVADKAYKLVMDQNNVGARLGFTGEMNGYYYATTEDQEEMMDVYLESVSGGYRMYFLDGGTKTYLNIIPRSGTTSTNVVLQTLSQNADPSVYQLNTQYRYMKTTVNGVQWYLGSYQRHYNISSSNISYISDVSDIGVSQFPAWFATVGKEQTPVQPPITTGDLDGVEGINEDDAIYLLQHVLMPESFAVNQNADFDGNGKVDELDAVYLLQHVLMPEAFPLG